MKSIIPVEVHNMSGDKQDTLIILTKPEKKPKEKVDKEIVSMIRSNPGIKKCKVAKCFGMNRRQFENVIMRIELNGVLFGELNECLEIVKEGGRYK